MGRDEIGELRERLADTERKIAAKVNTEWNDATRNPPPGTSYLRNLDDFIRSREGRALYDLRRRFGDLEPVEALAKLRAERHTDLAKSLNQDVGIEFLRKWVTEEHPRAR